MLYVWSAAKVGEVTILVESDGTVLESLDELTLVRIALFLKIFHSVGLGHFHSFESLLGLRQFKHFLFNGGKVGVADLPSAEIHVIVETGLDSRTYAELDSRIKRFERFCHKMG